MLFISIYTFRPAQRNEAVSRFLETGGPPPEGVKMLGRWHDAGLHRGFALAEANDIEAVAKWCHDWSDLLDFEVVPVLDDEQVGRVLSS